MERIYRRTEQKDLNELDNYDSVVSHPEPDILESKVEWVLGNTSFSKASGCYGISVELFKTLMDDAIKVLCSMSTNLEDAAVATGLEKVNPHPSSQEDSTKECANHRTIALTSHASKVMLKILHARLQHYASQELPDV